MTIGLKRGVVKLSKHNPEWEKVAAATVKRLSRIFGKAAKDIEHVGSTAIKNIHAKPIIDIAVAVDDFGEVEKLTPALETEGFMLRNWLLNENEHMLYAIGYDVPPDDRLTTHYIHVVYYNGATWREYLNFRDYLNSNVLIAKEYEAIKIELAKKFPYDPGREKYHDGKHEFIEQTLADAAIWREKQ